MLQGRYGIKDDPQLCDMAQDVWNRVQTRTLYDLALPKVVNGTSMFKVFDNEDCTFGPSVTVMFRQLPGDDYCCAVRLVLNDTNGRAEYDELLMCTADDVYMLILHMIGMAEYSVMHPLVPGFTARFFN